MAAAILSLLVYMPMLTWVSLWLGLRLRRRARAILTSLGVLVAWTVGPLLVIGLVAAAFRPYWLDDPPYSYLFLLSPATMVVLAEIGELDSLFRRTTPFLPIAVNFLWHGGILFFFRRLCLRHADRYLGRVPSPDLACADLWRPPAPDGETGT
jgi:ABC-type enterochelin transport system permease subunit